MTLNARVKVIENFLQSFQFDNRFEFSSKLFRKFANKLISMKFRALGTWLMKLTPKNSKERVSKFPWTAEKRNKPWKKAENLEKKSIWPSNDLGSNVQGQIFIVIAFRLRNQTIFIWGYFSPNP